MKTVQKNYLPILGYGFLLMVVLMGCRGQKSTEINVLCTVHEPWCLGMQEEFTREFGITVNFVRMSTGEALARLREEKEDPQFDLWWGGPIDSYILAKEEGLLQAYNSPNYANLLDQTKYKDPENCWAGIYVGSLGFCTNQEWLAAHPGVEPPHSWDDLLKPEFKNQVMVAHPSTSGTAYTLLSTILQLRGEAAGWEYMTHLTNQIFQFTKSGSTPGTFVGEGEAAVCITFSHDVIHRIEDQHLPLVLSFPEDGTGYEIGGLAIIQGAKHLDAAQIWFDWALTPAAQSLGPKYQAYQAPTVKGVDLTYPELLEVNLIEYDFTWSAEHKTEFVDRFIREIAAADNLKQ